MWGQPPSAVQSSEARRVFFSGRQTLAGLCPVGQPRAAVPTWSVSALCRSGFFAIVEKSTRATRKWRSQGIDSMRGWLVFGLPLPGREGKGEDVINEGDAQAEGSSSVAICVCHTCSFLFASRRSQTAGFNPDGRRPGSVSERCERTERCQSAFAGRSKQRLQGGIGPAVSRFARSARRHTGYRATQGANFVRLSRRKADFRRSGR